MPARSRKEQGFVLIVSCIALAVLLGLAGLLFDVGRMYVVKSELQAFADAASLSAALELDDSASGLQRARDAADAIAGGEHAMKWDMGSRSITGYKLAFGKGSGAPDPESFDTAPRDASGYRFAKVTVALPVPLTLVRAIARISTNSSTVAVSSLAVRVHGSANAARLLE